MGKGNSISTIREYLISSIFPVEILSQLKDTRFILFSNLLYFLSLRLNMLILCISICTRGIF
jgi:hypothetical protein